jgi:hypothetical protein
VCYKLGELSHLELAVEPKEKLNASISALKYDFNVKSYDIQVLFGLYKKEIVLGFGWAGNLGWKGEFSSFIPYEKQKEGEKNYLLSMSTGLD